MACIEFVVSPVAKPELSLETLQKIGLVIAPVAKPVVKIAPTQQMEMSVAQVGKVQLAITPVPKVQVAFGSVCSTSSGRMVVLAASDGPLRTRDGGYFLLDPATNPPEE